MSQAPSDLPANPAGPSANDGAAPSQSSDSTIHVHTRKQIARTFDYRLMPILFLAFLFFFLDKSNIAFARIHGLELDLQLDQYQFNIALVLFFVPNFILNIPGNLVLRRVGGARWLSCLIFVWGVVTFFTAFIKNIRGLYVTRIFLGIAESSFLGGALIYLGFFYSQDELIMRIGVLYAASPLAGFLGGFLAGGLSRIDTEFPVNGFSRWPWIFIAEGAATIVLGLLAFWLLPNTPAQFLRGKGMDASIERPLPSATPVEDAGAAKNTALALDHNDRLSAKLFKRAIFNPMTIIMAVGAFFSIEAIYSYALFLPTIIHTMGFRALTASLMTAPPNFIGFVGTLLVCYRSRKSGLTGSYLKACSFVGCLGFLFLLVGGLTGEPGERTTIILQYIGTFFVSGGVHPLPPLALTWLHINMSPHYVRAIALGFVFTVGNLAPFLASFTYIRSEAPAYARGHAINLGCLIGLFLISIATPWWMRNENAKRDDGDRNYRMDNVRWQGRPREEYERELGCLHPDFRYKI
jgi:hypothetical protein